MGNYKRRHAQDKLYITQKQMRTLNLATGGYKQANKADFKRLPFDCCSLSLRPAVKPMITRQGHVFDFINIIPWLKKYGTNPITGDPLSPKDLISVTFHQNTNQAHHCPVLYDLFTEQTHIVAIWTSGHIYSMRAINELCLKNKSKNSNGKFELQDLITNKPFTKDDIIDIQNPLRLEKFNFTQFHYLKAGIDTSTIVKNKNSDLLDENGSRIATSQLNKKSQEVADAIKDLEKEQDLEDENDTWKRNEKLDVIRRINNVYHDKQLTPATSLDAKSHFSTGLVGSSFTSTAYTRYNTNEVAIRDDREMRNKFIKEKGYVQLLTSFGPLNFELHCDLIPLACENFITLAKKKYYNGTIFHRLIPDFMVQGGDPEGTGHGGKSSFEGGKEFKDEFRQSLKFNRRGVLAMANRGPHSNLSQFFITLTDKHLDHLDRKHTIFGRLVGGEETLNKIEIQKTGDKNKPIEDIVLFKISIFVDPFENANRKIDRIKLSEQIEREEKIENDRVKKEEHEKRMAAIKRAREQNLTLEELLVKEKEELIASKPKGVGRYLPKQNDPQTSGNNSSKSLDNTNDRIQQKASNWDLDYDNINYEDFNVDKMNQLETAQKEKLSRIKQKKIEAEKAKMAIAKNSAAQVAQIKRPAETVKKLMKQQLLNRDKMKKKKAAFGNFSNW